MMCVKDAFIKIESHLNCDLPSIICVQLKTTRQIYESFLLTDEL